MSSTVEPLPGRVLGSGLLIAGALLALGGLSHLPARAVAVLDARLRAAGTVLPAEAAGGLNATDLRHSLLVGGAGLMVLAVVLLLLRPRGAKLLAAATPALARLHRGDWLASWLVPVMAGVVILVRFAPTLANGFFRYDDFEFVTVATTTPLWQAVGQPHGDHVMPLTRVLFHLGATLGGVNPLLYNLASLVVFWAVLVAGCRLLQALGASRGAEVLFASLFIGWSPWAEMLAGYYVLGVYLLITALSLTAVRSYLRWRQTGGAADALVAATAAAVAPLVDVSGWYASGACVLFLVTRPRPAPSGTPWSWLNVHRRMVVALSVAVVIPLALTAWAYAIAHPGLFLGMSGAGARSITHTLADFAYLIGVGVGGSMAVPFVYARLPGPLLLLLAIAAVCAVVSFQGLALRAAGPERRRTLLALLGVVAGIGLMVALGRPSQEGLVVRWAAKHVGPAYVWLGIALCFGWDTLRRHQPERRRARFIEITLLAILLFMAVQTGVGRLGLAVAFPPFGYPAEIRDARLRRAKVAALHRLVARLAATTDAPRTVPILEGARIQDVSPSLFRYNLSHYLPFFGADAARLDWVRNDAMQRWRTPAVRTVASLREAVPTATRLVLARDPVLREWYFGPAKLGWIVSTTSERDGRSDSPRLGAGERQPDGSWLVVSDGRTELVVERSAWDPESRSRLRLAADWVGGNASAIRIEVAFRADLLAAPTSATLSIPRLGLVAGEVDLLQLPAFALSGQVSDLRLRLVTPGRYRFTQLELAP